MMKSRLNKRSIGILAIVATTLSLIGFAGPASASEPREATSQAAPSPASLNGRPIAAADSVLSASPWVGTQTTQESMLVVRPNEAAGNYVYVCVLTTGNSYTMAHGTRTYSCGGSRIQQYLYGVFQQSVAISGYPPTVPAGSVTIGCILAGASLGVGIYAVIVSFGTLSVVSGLISTAGLAFCLA